MKRIVMAALLALGFLFVCGCASDCRYEAVVRNPFGINKVPVFTPATYGQVVETKTSIAPMYAQPAAPLAAPCSPYSAPVAAPCP